MNKLQKFLKSGPEVRMPSFKGGRPNLGTPKLRRGAGAGGGRKTPPGFLGDLYADLRDRRLLPLIGVILVAIVAAPFLLKDEADPEGPTAPSRGDLSTAESAGFAVVPADPGLRDYRERLAARPEENPFKPKVEQSRQGGAEGSSGGGGGGGAGAGEGASGAGGDSGGGSGSQSVEEDGGTSPETTSPESSGGSDGGDSGGRRIVREERFFFYRGVDLAISNEGRKPVSRPAVTALTKLPANKNPVVVFMGFSKDAKHALFLLTSRVLAYNGKVRCAVDKFNCQLLEVLPGRPVTYIYGASEKRLRINVTQFVTIAIDEDGKRHVVRPDG